MVGQIGNPLDGMASLQKSGMALGLRLKKTLEGIPELTTGWDSSKSVRVDLDKYARVKAIELNESWDSVLRGADLASAVLQAKTGAEATYSEVAAVASDASLEDAVPSDQPDEATQNLIERARNFGPTRSAVDIAESVIASLPDTHPAEDALAETDADPWVITSSSPITLTLECGSLVDVKIDSRWADSHSAAMINVAFATEVRALSQPDTNYQTSTQATDDAIVEALASLMNLAEGNS